MSEESFQFVELINKQQCSYEKIKALQTNYKKDSMSRKSIDYLNKRIEALESLWDEFRTNHEIIRKYEVVKKDHDYFKENIFNITRVMYDETLRSMTQLRNELINEPGFSGISQLKTPATQETIQFDTTGDETDKHLSTLLRNQLCNFNALSRAVSKICLDEMKEKWQCEDQLNVLKSKWECIDKIHWEISYLLQGKDADYEAKFDHWEQVYDSLKNDLNRKIFETSHYEKSTPRIELPEFNGSYNNWISFRDLFFEMIHNNPTLNKTQKMKFLKSKLKGEAEKLIKHLPVSAENYDSCLDIIQHRYNNKRLLFTSYIDTLLNQSSIDKQNSASLKRLHDTTKECLNALENIGIDIPIWGPLIVHLLSSKLDDETYSDYLQQMKHSRELPDLNEFIEYLELKFMTLETSRAKKGSSKQNISTNNQNQHKNYNNIRSTNFKDAEKWTKTYHASIRKCPLCKNDHALRQCPTFLNMNVESRNQTTSKLNLCKNCLFSHGGNKCTSTKRCRTCNFKHHSLLHDENLKGQYTKMSISQPTERSANHINGEQEILLTTVQIRVKNKEGDYVTLRALLDQGSQVTLITENAAQRLNLPRHKLNAAVTGVGAIMGTCKGMVNLECKSIHSEYSFQTEALIMRRLINNLPNSNINTENWTHLHNIKLADPEFNIPGQIDLLLSADIYSDVILEGVLKYNNESPIAQQTKLGWILCGATKQLNCLVTLTEDISKFWEIEDIPQDSQARTEDEYCEQYYTETTERLENGRYVVKMPMKPNYEQNLGSSKSQAVAQFLRLEKKMSQQEQFSILYKQFIQDYVELGHMKPVSENKSKVRAYLPHHGVLRESSTTTKLRAVFNASMKTSSGFSLNDLMEKGPNLQKDILSLIIKWRSYKYVLTADIEKMYRQILIHQNQQELQKIIWRNSTKEPLGVMQLCTLTYGTKAAPFIAMRTLQQLAADEGNAFPLAQKALQNDFYMDDLITGHSSIESARLLQKQLDALLRRGGFILRKWATNEPSILRELDMTEKSHNNDYSFKQHEFSKTLGLVWNDKNDTFHFISEIPCNNKDIHYTKRKLLSEISKIYDPLGWLAPMTIKAKLIFQKLWSEDYPNIGWDERVPDAIEKEWTKIKTDLPNINNISLQRWIKNEHNNPIELHAFCDASEQAYSCVIYSRTTSSNGMYEITLLAAKTKVAPLKRKTTIPRLELCGAVLLAKLIQKVEQVLANYTLRISCWTDSKVVLAWLQGNQMKYDKYITNRTKLIVNIVPAINWGYVRSSENPADCATRGLLPSKLVNFSLWWRGPQWLADQKEQTFMSSDRYTTNEGCTTNCYTINSTEPVSKANELINLSLERHSNIDRITRILAWVIRFADAVRNKRRSNRCNELELSEINNALCMIIKSVQENYFENDIQSLNKNGKLSTKSTILKLNPFLDPNGVLRVGGRLAQSNLLEEAKFPILIPSKGRLTQLLIEKAHQRTLHGGARLTLAYTREKFWIVSGNRTVKKILRQCIRCRRYAVTRTEQQMGQLPKPRVTPSRAFSNCAIDFTGHVELKINKGRGIKTCKGYIAIFVCMCTKAVHIELVSDLSTQTFIGALKRMCARRGTPKHIYSDNGTNFVGAAKLLGEEFQEYKTMLSSEFFKEINDLEIQWHFNAPSWPSAGGLWEAAVRSMKSHLKRVLGQQKLTYEQFTTLLTQIEACMNSRPLVPLTEDIEDLNYLTPGHFLTGSPTLSLPLYEPAELNSIDLRNNWKAIELMRRHYWDRWSKEYLHILQTRSKWQQAKENIQRGQLVLIKENNLPPGKWAMGRVLEVHPGCDDLVRVVTLKTQNGILKRPITKLTPLPINEICESTDSQNTKPATDYGQERKRTLKANKRVNSLLMMLLVAFTTLSCGMASSIQHFKITPLAPSQPIYFDPVGNIQLIHDEWKLLVYYNLTTFWQSTRKVEAFVGHLDQLCNTMPNEPCHATTKQLKFELNQLKEYNTLLLSQHKKRKRRGYVNGVGNLARTLFGVLDSDFAEKYTQDIQKVKTNEQYVLQLIRNQTLIIEAENNIMQKNENFLKSQLKVIQQYINETSHNMEVLENRFQIMKTMNDVNAGALTASSLLSILRRNQQMLLDALTDIYRGNLDIKLLTPEQLAQQLNYIAGIISKRLTLPVNNKTDIQNIYKLIYVKARLTDQYLLFELHIPLLSDDEYSLYHNIPILRQHVTNQCQAITTTSKYIGVNFAKNIYIQMDEDDLQQCTAMTADNYICHAYTTLRSLHGTTASCEAQMMSQNEKNITCDWDTLQCADQWIKLHKPNIWLYNCINECSPRIICENRITITSIARAGLLALGQDCVIQYKDSTIYSHNVFSSKTNIGISLEVPTIDSPNEMWSTFKGTRIVLSQPNLSQERNELGKQITAQRARESLPTELSIHDIGNYAMSTLLVGGVAVAIIVWRARKHLATSKMTTTKPRESAENIELKEIPTYAEIRGHSKNDQRTQPSQPSTETGFHI